MKPFYLILLIAVFFACQKKAAKVDLLGHWHIYYPDSTFGTWDILDSMNIIQDKNTYWGYYPIVGYDHSNLNSANQDTLIIAHYSEYIQSLPYEYIGDTLFLSDNSYAVKVDTTTCNLQEDFFGRLYIDIKLPSSDNVVFREKVIPERTLVSYIDIGNPKKHLKQYSPDTFLIQVNDTFIGYDRIVEYMEGEQAKLPTEERDSIILAFSVDKHTPAVVVDSIEQLINSAHPTFNMYYACLPGVERYVKESVFASLKNKFAKPLATADSIIDFSIYPGGEVTWLVRKSAKQPLFPGYSLQSTDGQAKLQGILSRAKQTGQAIAIRFTFTEDVTFQEYVTAQTNIRHLLEEEQTRQLPLQANTQVV